MIFFKNHLESFHRQQTNTDHRIVAANKSQLINLLTISCFYYCIYYCLNNDSVSYKQTNKHWWWKWCGKQISVNKSLDNILLSLIIDSIVTPYQTSKQTLIMEMMRQTNLSCRRGGLLADTGSFFETSLFKLVQTFSVLPRPTLTHWFWNFSAFTQLFWIIEKINQFCSII